MDNAPAAVRILFKAALGIFVITVVIGILNGIDVWDVPRNTLLTHVHAGTLGWITLGVFAAAIWMLGSPEDQSSRTLANFSVVALTLYMLAFWSVDLTTSSIQRPIGGTLAFIAMVWMFIWALRRKRGQNWNIAELGMGLALGFLVLGRFSVCYSVSSLQMSRWLRLRTPGDSPSHILGRCWLGLYSLPG
jgi:hypothetical protein